MQDPKFLNFFSKNSFKIVILILLSFIPFIYMCVCVCVCTRALNFSSKKDEHKLLFCMYFFGNFNTCPYQNRFYSSFLNKKIKHATKINQELIFSSFFCISLNPREKETKKNKKTIHRYGKI
jgi:hypothetical protein